MDGVVELVGPNQAVQIFGVRLVGVTGENLTKLLFTIALVLLVWGLGRLLRGLTRRLRKPGARPSLWASQFSKLLVGLLFLLGFLSIWFDDPSRLTTGLGLVSAGLVFALQKVVTAIAGYFVILRGNIFNVGDRILMGGVRGDVIALGYTRTTIMEMGQPPDVRMPDPAMWVASRQYTGRIVTISNGRIFDEPVYNYTADFPFLWEELRINVAYRSDRRRAEAIMLAAAERHTVSHAELSEDALQELQRRYFVERASVAARVYYRLTQDGVELTVRFIAREHGIRELKDRLSRDILDEFEQAGISIASSTHELVDLPPIRILPPGA